MNRKNTILIAVMVNSGLLAILLIAALTSQEEVAQPTQMVAEAPMTFPAFDDSLFQEPSPKVALTLPVVEAVKEAAEPVIHKLPPLAAEPVVQTPAPVQQTPVQVAKVSAPAPAPKPAVVAATTGLEVSVKKGDTLEKIAKANQTSVNELIKLNRLSSSLLKVGQVLKIPAEKIAAKTPEKKKAVELGPEYYTIKVGESPWAIAMKHHMKVEELLRLNGLNEEKARKLKAGDRLRIR